VLAALYLDGGISPARAFVCAHILEPELARLSVDKGEVHLEADHKSRLQQLLLAAGRPEPRYELAEAIGPDHRKSFVMRVLVMDSSNAVEFEASGSGSTKKSASQNAAAEALARLEERDLG
jgi:ribonuclease-3